MSTIWKEYGFEKGLSLLGKRIPICVLSKQGVCQEKEVLNLILLWYLTWSKELNIIQHYI